MSKVTYTHCDELFEIEETAIKDGVFCPYCSFKILTTGLDFLNSILYNFMIDQKKKIVDTKFTIELFILVKEKCDNCCNAGNISKKDSEFIKSLDIEIKPHEEQQNQVTVTYEKEGMEVSEVIEKLKSIQVSN